MTAKKQISVDPSIMAILALSFFAFVGGIAVKGAFLSPTPPDLRAEYCRGYADGDQVRYQVVYDVFDRVQVQSDGNGFEAGLITRDPATGSESDIVPVTGEGGFLPVPDATLLDDKETSCYDAPLDALQGAGLRGPSDEKPEPITETTMP